MPGAGPGTGPSRKGAGRPCGAVFAVRPRGGLQTVSAGPLPAAGSAANTIFAQILHCHGGGGAAVFSIIERKHTGELFP